MDDEGQGHLNAANTMAALRAVNPTLSDADEDFIYTVSIVYFIYTPHIYFYLLIIYPK